VVVGVDTTVLWASTMMLLLVSAIPVPALAGYYGAYYMWGMELAVVPGLLAASYLILERPGHRTFGLISWILKVGMFFGVLAVALGNL